MRIFKTRSIILITEKMKNTRYLELKKNSNYMEHDLMNYQIAVQEANRNKKNIMFIDARSVNSVENVTSFSFGCSFAFIMIRGESGWQKLSALILSEKFVA